MKNTIEFEVYGDLALFTDPSMGNKDTRVTYPVPTYGVLVGVSESIYWQPTFYWVIDAVRVMAPIATYTMATSGQDPRTGKRKILENNFLYEPRYQVRAHFEWDLSRTDLAKDRISGKHYSILKRYLDKGGKLPVCLGVSECCADVDECEFGTGEGYYDKHGKMSLGIMCHSTDYAKSQQQRYPLWWNPVMENGIIKYIRPEECSIRIAA